MILPGIIQTRNKVRDAQILELYVENGFSQTVIAEKFGLHQSRIAQILKKNASSVIASIKDYDKLKRLHFLNDALTHNIPIAKTKLDIIDAKRKEFEGDKEISGDKTVVNVYIPGRETLSINNTNRIKDEVT